MGYVALLAQAAADAKGAAVRTKFHGVSKVPSGKFAARITHPVTKKLLWLGTYLSPEVAACAYDLAAKELQGRKARPNFGYPSPAKLVEEVLSARRRRSHGYDVPFVQFVAAPPPASATTPAGSAPVPLVQFMAARAPAAAQAGPAPLRLVQFMAARAPAAAPAGPAPLPLAQFMAAPAPDAAPAGPARGGVHDFAFQAPARDSPPVPAYPFLHVPRPARARITLQPARPARARITLQPPPEPNPAIVAPATQLGSGSRAETGFSSSTELLKAVSSWRIVVLDGRVRIFSITSAPKEEAADNFTKPW